MSKHKHLHREKPRCDADAAMLDAIEAEECLYLCIGLIGGKVAAIGHCEYLTKEEAIAILEQCIQTIRKNPGIEESRLVREDQDIPERGH